ncbi:MAG: phage terminase large subunit [Clostridia bacterium]|nr:phage terminase large subunit [Clostridia bacterium]
MRNTPLLRYLRALSPYEPQEKFFRSDKRRIAYGGARGGGKSFAMRTKLILLALNFPGIQILLLRRSYPQLRENHINPLRRILFGSAVYRESTKEFTFPNSSRIKLGYMDTEADALQYQGQAYEVIGMEEATQFTERQYQALTECCRLSGMMKEKFVPRMYFTCNPGGVGHGWIKRLFIDREYREGEDPADYEFIPSTVFDNKYLMENNPEYLKNLQSLPELRKKAMLYGDWDAFEGQYFPEFDRSIHVVQPYGIPEDWVKFACLDYGLDMTACLWLAYPRDHSRIAVYRELYEPDLILSEAAQRIARAGNGEKLRYITASPDLAGRRQDSGKSGFDIMRSQGLNGLVAANNERIPGWRRLREYLAARNGDRAYLEIFSCCKNLIRTLPRLSFDPVCTEDVCGTPHEYTHAPDALRYALTSLPFLPAAPAPEKKEDPLGFYEAFFGKKREQSYMRFISE